MRTLVTFESSVFNTSEVKDYFINDVCFGDDVAKWLIAALRRDGFAVDDEPGQGNWGWYFEFVVPEGKHCVSVGFRPEDPEPDGCWIVWIERNCGLLGWIFGGHKRGVAFSAVLALHSALQSAEIRNIRWHEKKDFDALREDLGAPNP